MLADLLLYYYTCMPIMLIYFSLTRQNVIDNVSAAIATYLSTQASDVVGFHLCVPAEHVLHGG